MRASSLLSAIVTGATHRRARVVAAIYTTFAGLFLFVVLTLITFYEGI